MKKKIVIRYQQQVAREIYFQEPVFSARSTLFIHWTSAGPGSAYLLRDGEKERETPENEMVIMKLKTSWDIETVNTSRVAASQTICEEQFGLQLANLNKRN